MYKNYNGLVDRNRGEIYRACPVKTGVCTTSPVGTIGALAKAQAHVRDDDEFVEGEATGLVDLDSDELNFQNPTSLMGPLTIGQPRMLQAQLKEYQLKGLNWPGTLYDQGINGILADEMGLGKSVQSISLLAYLAETHDIWGPFLVVAPASTLYNCTIGSRNLHGSCLS